jgi:hypothetical protein
VIEGILMGILNTLPTSDDSIQASDPKGQPSQASHPRGTQSESLTPAIDVETTVASPEEAKDAPDGRPLSNVPRAESHDKYWRYWPKRLGDADMRLRHIFQKAGALAWRLYYMDCDVGMVVPLVRMVGILVVICIALYHLWGAIIYALRDQDMVY